MHALHKILVYIPDLGRSFADREELIQAVRTRAIDATEIYRGRVWDGRTTDFAGGWQDEYPENVLLASEDPEQFAKELEKVVEHQSTSIREALAELPSKLTLEEAVSTLWNSRRNPDSDMELMAPYYFHKAAAMLYGEYLAESMFYNAHSYTARLYPEDIRKLKAEPNNWALVLFDYHF